MVPKPRANLCNTTTALLLTLLCVLPLSACMPQDVPSPAVPTAATTVTRTLTPTPGLILRGRVHLQDGSGLGSVTICRNFASYPGVIAASTGADGTFQSDFTFIPGDEMVGVWPRAAGSTFEPAFVRWRHYYSFEDRVLDFIAVPTSVTAPPPGPCS
jgi:hypothetical protein